MGHRERSVDRGRRRGRELTRTLIGEYRTGRIAVGLSQLEVGAAVGLSDSEISRIETGRRVDIPIELMSALLAVVGRDLAANAYPVGSPLRDSAHLALLERLRSVVTPSFRWLTEVPIRSDGLRAWDAMLVRPGCRIGVEAETRVRDVQGVERSVQLKLRDSGIERAILLLSDTRHHRQLLRDLGPHLGGSFPLASRAAIEALRAGRDPGANAIVLL
jgi:transcriptional regulator with XRE-family HTH domain